MKNKYTLVKDVKIIKEFVKIKNDFSHIKITKYI